MYLSLMEPVLPGAIVAALSYPGRVIGRGVGLPWHLPLELRLFRALTWGGVLVMGRRTWEGIGRVLPGREVWVWGNPTPQPPFPQAERGKPPTPPAPLSASREGESHPPAPLPASREGEPHPPAPFPVSREGEPHPPSPPPRLRGGGGLRFFSSEVQLVEAILAARKPVFYVGGAQLFAWALPRVRAMYLTWVYGDFVGEVLFPPFSEEAWEAVAWEYFTERCVPFVRVQYVRR